MGKGWVYRDLSSPKHARQASTCQVYVMSAMACHVISCNCIHESHDMYMNHRNDSGGSGTGSGR